MRALLVSLALVGLVGCTMTDAPPELATVVDLVPRAPELGERMDLVGTGFPEGKPATLTFRGDLHRPGQAVVHGVSILLRAASSRGDRVSWVVTDQLVADFSGTGPEAAHTTFHGDVIAAFAPRKSGAPPITGTLHEVSLDWPPPSLPEREAVTRQAESDRVLGELGLRLGDDPERRGLVVAGLEPRGRAAQGGLVTGDVVTEFDGVRVRQAGDLVPRAGQRFARALVKRPGLPDALERVLAVDGVRPAAPSELVPAGVMLGLAVALLLLVGAPVARLITWTEGRLALRLHEVLHGSSATRPTGARWAAGTARRVLSALLPRAQSSSFETLFFPLALCTVSALFAAFARGLSLLAAELDLPLVLLGSLTASVTAGLLVGGSTDKGPWSLRRGLRSALLTLGLELPVAMAFLCTALVVGSTRPEALVEGQGSLPWEWAVFRSPLHLAAAVLSILPLIPETGASREELPEAESRYGGARGGRSAGDALAALTDWTHLLVVSYTAALLFFGGYKLPFVVPATQRISLAWQLVGAGVLGVKAGAVLLLVLGLRWISGRLRIGQVSGICWRWLVPLSIGLLALRVASMEMAQTILPASLESQLGVVLFGVCSFVLLRLGRRLILEFGRTSHPLGVNPWL